ncbi:MAG TPA: ATP-binding protein [Oceanipulchritudo sp.]|nr:ATP-binding protein [Oceanipulchritudo sp.]
MVLLATCAYLAWRQLAAVRLLRQLREAIVRREPLLRESRISILDLDRLTECVNQLLGEHAGISKAEISVHDQIQALLGNLREAVVMTGEGGRILTANPAFLELVGIQALPDSPRLESFLGGTAFYEFLNQLGTSGTIHRREMEVQIGRELHWLEISAAPIMEENSSGPAILFVLHDISRQKRLEQMRTDFVANVSHELRTPVTVIKGFAETLQEDDAILSMEERAKFLEKIRNNAERLDALLRDLLLLARLESTEMVLHRERISLSALVKELAGNWRAEIEAGGRSLLLEFDRGEDTVEVDPLRFTQVINNLVENSLRHAHGFTQIRISTRCAGEGLYLSISDDGSGIPEHELPHVFQRFYRVDKGRSRDSGGTGLGLSIVKHIVLQHGGRIQAHSGKGEGTRIEILLPKAVEQTMGNKATGSAGTD